MSKLNQFFDEEINDIEVPEGLKPENMVKKIQANKRSKRRKNLEIAATIAVVVGISGIGINMGVNNYKNTSDNAQNDVSDDATTNSTGELSKSKTSKVGTEYKLAKGYDEVLDLFAPGEQGVFEEFVSNISGKDSSSIAYTEDAASTNEEYTEDAATLNDGNEGETSASTDDYSKTNTVEDNVDESDIVKIDGNYIYKVKDTQVTIVDIQNEKMSICTQVKPDISSADIIEEIYVDGDKLSIIVDSYSNDVDSNFADGEETEVYTYDISDRENPKLLGTYCQSGCYNTSRKVGDDIYIFTENYCYGSEEKDEVIPYINDGFISDDCIYISDDAYEELVVSSFDINEPSETIDQMMVCHNGAEIYMSSDGIYLYEYDYTGSRSVTNISKFAFKDGIINGVGSNTVVGTINDTFAISESDGYLRVITSDSSRNESTNTLYVFDENMEESGRVSDIAVGEEIYAARYINDMAYFITYRNTDPLYVADLSDPSNPKLLGNVEITGFSEYLHKFSDDQLLGLGYEYDSSDNDGNLKLVMFDISDSSNPEIKGTKILDSYYSSALYNYKEILVNGDKNLIGFEMDGDENSQYVIYSWDGKHFDEELTYEAEGYCGLRGLYAGNTFYLLEDNTIKSFDMSNNFETLDEISL